MPAVVAEKLGTETKGESSRSIREKVEEARIIQEKRFAGKKIFNNAQMKNKEVKEHCPLDGEVRRLLYLAVSKYDLSARAYFRLIKVARTIADFEGSEAIWLPHMAEALQFRERVF